MRAVYADETSNLRVSRIAFEFLGKHVRNFGKRLFYNYFLRDMSIASIELVWARCCWASVWSSAPTIGCCRREQGVAAPLGTIMLSALSVLTGLQLVLAFLSYDIAAVPRRPIHDLLPER